MRPRTIAMLAALAAVLAACGGAAAKPAAAPQAPPGPILVVIEQGGLELPGLLRPLPRVFVSADGRLLTRGPLLGTRSSALPNVRQRQLSAAGLQRLRKLVSAAGVDRRPPDYGHAAVADAPTTEIAYRTAAGRTYTHRVFALAEDTGLPPSQRDARARLRRLLDQVTHPERTFDAGELGPDRAYAPTAFGVAAARVEYVIDPPVRGATPWPLDSVRLAQAQECTAVTGPDAGALAKALRDPNAGTPWIDAGADYTVDVRPALPGETACP